MTCRYVLSYALGLVSAALLLATPQLAHACDPDPECAGYDELSSPGMQLHHGGSVFFFASRFSRIEVSPQQVLEAFTVEAMDDAGDSYSGTVQLAYRGPTVDVIAWRPDETPPAGSSLSLAVSVDNDALAPHCIPTLDEQFEFTVTGVEPMEPALPATSFTTTYSVLQPRQIDDLACCDGAYPSESLDSCGFASVDWTEGECIPLNGIGRAQGSIDIDPFPEAAVGHTLLELRVDGEVVSIAAGSSSEVRTLSSTGSSSATQMSVAVVNLIDGSTIESEAYTNDGGNPEALGEVETDLEEFAAQCEEEPYACELDDEDLPSWDPQACAPVGRPGQSSEDGGGCSIGGNASWSGWLLLLALGIRSRRRRR